MASGAAGVTPAPSLSVKMQDCSVWCPSKKPIAVIKAELEMSYCSILPPLPSCGQRIWRSCMWMDTNNWLYRSRCLYQGEARSDTSRCLHLYHNPVTPRRLQSYRWHCSPGLPWAPWSPLTTARYEVSRLCCGPSPGEEVLLTNILEPCTHRSWTPQPR